MMTNELCEILQTKICSYFIDIKEINTVYLHGSIIKGYFREDSDIDIALLINSESESDFNIIRRLQMASDLECIIKRKVDLGILSSNNLIYAKEVIENGVIIFCRDDYKKGLFEATILSMYCNFQLEREEILHEYSA